MLAWQSQPGSGTRCLPPANPPVVVAGGEQAGAVGRPADAPQEVGIWGALGRARGCGQGWMGCVVNQAHFGTLSGSQAAQTSCRLRHPTSPAPTCVLPVHAVYLGGRSIELQLQMGCHRCFFGASPLHFAGWGPCCLVSQQLRLDDRAQAPITCTALYLICVAVRPGDTWQSHGQRSTEAGAQKRRQFTIQRAPTAI